MVIHCVPIRVADFEIFINNFEDLIKKRNLAFFPLLETENIIDLTKQDELYVVLELYGGEKKYLIIFSNVP
jgi:hypothetical protein